MSYERTIEAVRALSEGTAKPVPKSAARRLPDKAVPLPTTEAGKAFFKSAADKCREMGAISGPGEIIHLPVALGGRRRADSLSPERRKEIGKAGAAKRWGLEPL